MKKTFLVSFSALVFGVLGVVFSAIATEANFELQAVSGPSSKTVAAGDRAYQEVLTFKVLNNLTEDYHANSIKIKVSGPEGSIKPYVSLKTADETVLFSDMQFDEYDEEKVFDINPVTVPTAGESTELIASLDLPELYILGDYELTVTEVGLISVTAK